MYDPNIFLVKKKFHPTSKKKKHKKQEKAKQSKEGAPAYVIAYKEESCDFGVSFHGTSQSILSVIIIIGHAQ